MSRLGIDFTAPLFICLKWGSGGTWLVPQASLCHVVQGRILPHDGGSIGGSFASDYNAASYFSKVSVAASSVSLIERHWREISPF